MPVRTLYDNRAKVVTVTKPNASANYDWTGASAPTGAYILPQNIHDPTTGIIIATSDRIRVTAVADNLFECIVVTLLAGGVTASRADADVVSGSSGRGARVDFSGASVAPTIFCEWDALNAQTAYNLSRPQIYGLPLTYTSATAFGAGPGCAFIEGVDGAPLASAALADLTAQTGTAAHFYHVYEYLNSGVLTLEKVDGGVAGSTNAPVAFSIPAGSARSKPSDTSRRFLGTILYAGTDVIRPFTMTDRGGGIAEFIYKDSGAATPFSKTLVNNSTYSAVDFSALIPNNGCAVEALINFQIALSGASGNGLYYSLDGTNFLALEGVPSASPAGGVTYGGWLPINADTTQAFFYKTDVVSGGNSTSCFIWAYRFRR